MFNRNSTVRNSMVYPTVHKIIISSAADSHLHFTLNIEVENNKEFVISFLGIRNIRQ